LTESKKEFTLEDIKACDGSGGQPVYIVYQGRVIDVTKSPLWHTGHHMGAHKAGHDLTSELAAAPHGPEVLDRYPEVGQMRPGEVERPVRQDLPPFLTRLFHAVPLAKRHPHPMVVHFPIVFMMSAAGFTLLALLTGQRSFELTGWYCLWGGVLFSVPAIATGLVTWWINYHARWLRQVTIKMILSPLMLLLGTATLVWRCLDPEVLVFWRPLSYLYLGCLLALASLAGAIGWFGGTLSFPLEND
jgi:predicted heme/steroid binding protein/uncharacterized membrane protein